MMVTLDVRTIVQMASELDEPQSRQEAAYRSISFEVLDPALLDALVRLVALLDEPALVPSLAPLIQREITIRLLNGPHGPQLRHLVSTRSPSQQIAKAVAWLKQNFVQALHGDDLADRAHMSPSTFRQHFRTLTSVSPLQYQKQLRLQEARQLMLNENLDAGSAAGRVGYESASQFSREYSRLFGAPPQRDVTRLRLARATAVDAHRAVAGSTTRGTRPRLRSARSSLVSR
jgi:transcriptional regulator GlxA family with amidase domain